MRGVVLILKREIEFRDESATSFPVEAEVVAEAAVAKP